MKKKQPKISSKKIDRKPAKNPVIILVLITAILFLLFGFSFIPRESQEWSVSKDGILSYPEHRGQVDVTVLKTESGSDYIIETISFASKDYNVEGLLRIPSIGKKVPAVVILAGATVTKEGTQGLAGIFSSIGYASLGIEQRNRGGVDPEYDYGLFMKGNEPVEHKMVFDALRAVDVLRQDERIDAQKISIVGESNGGRFAIIAAALDPDIKGVIGISTSGYNTESRIFNVKDKTLIRFYRSIDPETYLGLIPPRKFVMLHSVNDSIIKIEFAENTFKKAKEPKKFYPVKTGDHGFSEDMKAPLEEELRLMFR